MRTHLLVALTLLSGAVLARAQQVPGPGTLPPGTGLPPGISSLPSTLPGASPGGMGIPTTGTLVGSPILSGDGSIAGPITEGVPVSGGGARQGAQRFWLAGRYRIGWMAKQNLPYPLLTTGPTTDPAPGSLRQPGTQIVYGNEIDYSVFKGFEVEAGYFLDDEGRYSVDASGFVLFQNTDTFQATSDSTGAPLLARPVYNVLNHQEGAYLNSYPTAIVGSSQIVSKANLWGFETNSRYHFAWSPRLHGNGLVGFRYMNLAESLRISDQLAPLRTNTLTFLGDFVNAPDSLADVDSFVTRNQFYGGQLGGQVTWEDTWFFLTLNAKIALGATHQKVDIQGNSTLVRPVGGDVAVPGGILAQPTNIGSRSRTVFGMLPEWGVTGGLYVTEHIRVSAGYSIFLWNRVLRPGNTIDPGVNPGQVPTDASYGVAGGPPQPQTRFMDGSFWVQNFTAGLEFTY